RFPRRIIEVAPGRFWIADLGSWEPGRGRLLQFELPAAGAAGPVAMTVIADKLDRPHGLALGPDGRVYVGEAGRIWRTPATLPGENSIDYADENAPAEELNVIRAGADYGWPYCVGARQVARGYEGRVDCARSEAPLMLWPAHAAPLQMLAVAAGTRNDFAGQLVVAWHGYRAAGHRVVSFRLDASGRPRGPPRPWIEGWSATPNLRPLGAPAGIL